jgi:DNA mismatch endonuclease (patch repair protein)
LADVVDKATRSRMMSGIRGKDTAPEMIIRRGLHARGFRYRLHDPRLAGRPDLVLLGRRAILLVQGCFWHGHDCHLFRWPTSRQDFWREKIGGNIQRDRETVHALRGAGWRLLTVWECALKGRARLPAERVLSDIARWLVEGGEELEIRGIDHGACRSGRLAR